MRGSIKVGKLIIFASLISAPLVYGENKCYFRGRALPSGGFKTPRTLVIGPQMERYFLSAFNVLIKRMRDHGVDVFRSPVWPDVRRGDPFMTDSVSQARFFTFFEIKEGRHVLHGRVSPKESFWGREGMDILINIDLLYELGSLRRQLQGRSQWMERSNELFRKSLYQGLYYDFTEVQHHPDSWYEGKALEPDPEILALERKLYNLESFTVFVFSHELIHFLGLAAERGEDCHHIEDSKFIMSPKGSVSQNSRYGPLYDRFHIDTLDFLACRLGNPENI